MRNMDLESKVMVGGFVIVVLLIITLVASMLISSSRSREYKVRCVNAGGVHLRTEGQDFCIKEFLPLGGSEE